MYHDEFEPFVRVFRIPPTATEEDMRKVMDAKWTDKNDDSVLMRTASFGHGRQRLDMCLREGILGVGPFGADLIEETISANLLVPLAIMSSFRKRAYETRLKATWRNHLGST